MIKTTRPGAARCGAPDRAAWIAGCLAIATILGAPQARAAATYATFDPPNSGGTHPTGINEAGVIAGWFSAPDGYNGFIRAVDGTITTVDPGANGQIMIFGINASGATTGYVCLTCPNAGSATAFVRAATGKLRLVTIANSTSSVGNAINTKGMVAGGYSGTDTFNHGFVSSPNGTGTGFDVPGTGVGTTATAINDAGTIAGIWGDANQVQHGFVRSASGVITTFDPPDSISTQVFGIDKAGAITGYYSASSNGHSYIRAPDGTFTFFDVGQAGGTAAYAISTKGSVAGIYEGGGFVRSVAGKIKTFNPPNSLGTGVSAINAGSLITGTTYQSDDLTHGYLRTP
jgi:hypothetical protein